LRTLILLALSVSCTPTAELEETGDSSAPEAALPAGLYAIDARDAEGSSDDLAPLGVMIDGVEVAALGESIHTSGGFYRAKHKLIRTLVEDHGYRVVAFENPWTMTEPLDEHLREGGGDAASLVASSLFSPWVSEETLALMEWLRAWNVANPEDQVSLMGFDIQQPWHDGPALTALLDELEPDEADAMRAAIATCDGATHTSIGEYVTDPSCGQVNDVELDSCTAGLDALEAWLATDEDAIRTQIGAEALELAWLHALSLRAWQRKLYYAEVDYSNEVRDEGMAEVFLRLRALRHPEEKTVIWAANWHIARHAEDMVASIIDAANMGGMLDDALGRAYAPFALSAYELSYQWPGQQATAVPAPTSEYAVELLLHDHGTDLLVDLEATDEDSITPGATWRLGCTDQSYAGADLLVPAEHYRGLIYLEVSEAMTSL
jgi:erythromycin esterase